MESNSVKVWLKAIRQDRKWLAEQTGSKIRTVNNWLSSSRGIPMQAERLILRLMEQYSAGTSASSISDAPENTLVLTADASTFDAWNEAAAREGKLLRQWACDVLTEQASKVP
jgi:hypothetical protein